MVDGRKVLILIIEDDFTSCNTIAKMLFKKEYNVICAENGEEAINIMKTCVPNCILLDLLMPKMHGHAFLTLLRKTNQNLPVIIMSAVETQPVLLVTIKKLGISGWLSKPIRGKKLLELIENVVRPENETDSN